MSARGRLIFWLVFLGVLVFALTTLREVMLPFVAWLGDCLFS
jgi:hypothetical protein